MVDTPPNMSENTEGFSFSSFHFMTLPIRVKSAVLVWTCLRAERGCSGLTYVLKVTTQGKQRNYNHNVSVAQGGQKRSVFKRWLSRRR